MTLTNHALTGAVIGVAVANPLVALPLALISHFLCDMLPHYGPGDRSASEKDKIKRQTGFAIYLGVEVVLCVALVIILFLANPVNGWLLPAVCAFLATLPDLAWLPGYLRVRHGGQFVGPGRPKLLQLAADIQWFEKPVGGLFEIAWFLAGVAVLGAYLLN